MSIEERALCFACNGETLYGILSLPKQSSARGVLIIVGGPQYRAGSHRQFTLLARALAAQGIPAMRFDYRGMGDSYGGPRNFENISEDIRTAIDHFFDSVPGLQEVALWGLCDAASAALFYCHSDTRVRGLALLNPWVRTEQGLAKAYLKRYYLKRAFDGGLWRKILRGDFDFLAARRSLMDVLRKARSTSDDGNFAAKPAQRTEPADMPLPDRMYEGLRRFDGHVMLVLSGDDMTAQEFSELISTSRKWRQLIKKRRIFRRHLAAANHTFSRQAWREQVANWTTEWLSSW